jgi:hypothetical protein
MSFMKFQIYASMSAGFDQQADKGSVAATEIDEVRRMFMEYATWYCNAFASVDLRTIGPTLFC